MSGLFRKLREAEKKIGKEKSFHRRRKMTKFKLKLKKP